MVGPSKHLKFNAPRASSFTSFGFFVAISVLMMVVDHQMQVMEPVRSGFAWVSDWIHNGVASPARGVDFADSYLRSKSSLIAQNEELKKRLVGRGTETLDVINGRLRRAVEESKGMDKYDYLLINDDLEECVDTLHETIRCERMRASRNHDFVSRIQKEAEAFL